MKLKVVSATLAKFKGRDALRIIPDASDTTLPEFDTIFENVKSRRVEVNGDTGEILLLVPDTKAERFYTREAYDEVRSEFENNRRFVEHRA